MFSFSLQEHWLHHSTDIPRCLVQLEADLMDPFCLSSNSLPVEGVLVPT